MTLGEGSSLASQQQTLDLLDPDPLLCSWMDLRDVVDGNLWISWIRVCAIGKHLASGYELRSELALAWA